MTKPTNASDPIGPGTPAWEHSESAILHGVNGRVDDMQASIDAMTRELIAHGASANVVREWEAFIAEAIENKRMNLDGEWID